MSKRLLTKHLQTLNQEQLSDLILDLYNRSKEVKTYFSFVFNPNERKELETAKQKVYEEYFPVKRKRAKMRRSIATKYLKHFDFIGLHPSLVAEFMVFNLQTQQLFSTERYIKQDSFFTAALTSFDKLCSHLQTHRLEKEFMPQLEKIIDAAFQQNWFNAAGFDRVFEDYFGE